MTAAAYNKDYDSLLPQYTENLQERYQGYEEVLKYDFWVGDYVTLPDFVFYELLDQNQLMIPGSSPLSRCATPA